MNKSIIKEINIIIKNMDNSDYICRVKYVIFFICNVIYSCRLNGFDILNDNFSYFKCKYGLNEDDMNIFTKYKKFNLNFFFAEEKIYELISNNRDDFSENFQPASLYEILLTSKERKSLGQVYTPIKIIDQMLTQIFTVKSIDKNTTILDPSCGGGYFLIEAFKKIKNQCLENVDDRYILEHMLYGIDIDDFSIFLTKMGLLFCSACTQVNFNIINTDFLIDSFDFNYVNKFDIIVGNPPYVGHKNSSAEYKKVLYEKYQDVFYDKADISYCFFKKSKDLLSSDGIISFITSRYFMEALYADKLRTFIISNFHIVSLLDYSGSNIFKDVMVSPAVITLSNIAGNKDDFSYVKCNEDNDFTEKFNFSQNKLKNSGWIILKDCDEQLFDRIESISNTYIKDVCNIKQGIITGLDKAFIVDEETIEKYKIESFLLRKWIKNSNIRDDGIKYNNLYLIYSNNIENEFSCPNAIKYLSTYHEKLMERRECIKGFRKWYELQWGRNQFDFENPKIVFPYKSKGNNFYYDTNEYFCSADIYFINDLHENVVSDYMISYLNSNVFEFYFKCQTKKVGNNLYEYYPNKLNNVKIYLPQESTQQNISDLGKISIEFFLKKVFNISEEEVNNIINKYIQKR
ncbi:MAG: N-6 DNA methylase [Sedimentibacter sp.]|uniref:Eco57I restriction-modification methylase domain-containing protein n=1 Tax=Sedimentibacter sp. TaxID=1960295 RepID=UPI002980A76C|nr:N-6 DNA methylase [Sedimentibacter sp.]MDW5299657.1 N-6 DNA methylase [Sedimentibacter sp.]